MAPTSLRARTALLSLLLPATVLVGCGSDEPAEVTGAPESTPEQTTTMVTTTVAAPTAAEGDLNEQVVAQILDTTWETLEDTTMDVDMSAVLTAAALEEFENQRLEWTTNEWRQEGRSVIASSDVTIAPDQQSATARLCIDSTGVTVLDENGVVVNDAHPDTPQRTLTIAQFVKADGVWKLAAQQIADDPNC